MTTRQAGGIALVLVVLSVFLATLFQTIEMLDERDSLSDLHNLQDNSVREAGDVRHRFDALASGLLKLDAAGDAGAHAVIEEMRRQGLNLQPRKP